MGFGNDAIRAVKLRAAGSKRKNRIAASANTVSSDDKCANSSMARRFISRDGSAPLVGTCRDLEKNVGFLIVLILLLLYNERCECHGLIGSICG